MCSLWTEFPDDYELCDRCAGLGTIRCPQCGGSGGSYEYDFDGNSEWQSCSTCSGSGERTCPQCWGTGSERRRRDWSRPLDEGDDFDTDPGDPGSSDPGTVEADPNGSDFLPSGTIECAECVGSGEVACRFCHGTGRELVPSVWGSSFQPCEWCKSTGVEVCDECHGRGWVWPPCETCNGTGATTCELCDGTGRFELDLRRFGSDLGFGRTGPLYGNEGSGWRGWTGRPSDRWNGGTAGGVEETCPRCSGRGKVECAPCGGLGVRYTTGE